MKYIPKPKVTILHDLSERDFSILTLPKGTLTILSADDKFAPCQGCFRCWLKNSGYCFMTDSLQHAGSIIGNSDSIIVISRLCYGCYSPKIKNIWDRSISLSTPFLTYRGWKTHHTRRYHNKPCLHVYFYGDSTPCEQNTARELVKSNCINMGFAKSEVVFVDSPTNLQEVSL